MYRWLLILLLPVLLVSCVAGKKNAYNTLPPAASLPALRESAINIPLNIVLTKFLANAQVLIPKEITSDGWPQYQQTSCDFHYKYRFIPGGFTFSCSNNQLQVKLGGAYQVAGEKCVCAFGKQTSPWIGGSCGFGKEPMRKTDIYIKSAVQIQPGYTVRTRSFTDRVVAPEKCLVSVFNLDITQQVLDSIKASTNAFCYSLDSVLNSMDFAATTRQLAQRINQKIPLDVYGFLRINPSAVTISPLNSKADSLQLILGISCYPEILSDSTNNFTASFLPPLQSGSLVPGITVYSNARYDYPFLSTLLNRQVKDSTFRVEGHTVIIRNVSVSGAGEGKVEIAVDFEGDRKGTLFLAGTPLLDTANQLIVIPDLDYSLKSKDLLLNLGKTFFSNKILKALREKASVSISSVVEQNRPSIDAQFNRVIREGVTTTGSFESVRIIAIVVGKETLQAQFVARANARIIITDL